MRKTVTKLLSVSLALIAIFSVFSMSLIPASAATSGSTNTRTITVVTKANYFKPGASSITLKQNKQTLTMYKTLKPSKTKTKNGYYGYYKISVLDVSANKSTQKTWDGKSSVKITFKPNKTYKVTVSYDYNGTWLNQLGAVSAGYTLKKATNPSWSISSTNKLASYY